MYVISKLSSLPSLINEHIKIAGVGIFIIMMWLCTISPMVYAQDSSSSGGTEVSGELVQIQDREITVESDSSTQTFQIPDNTLVELNEREASVSDIQPGDQVTLSLDSENNVVQVEAISGNVFDWATWLIALVILLLVIGIIALILWQRKRGNNIKTATATATRM